MNLFLLEPNRDYKQKVIWDFIESSAPKGGAQGKQITKLPSQKS